MNKEETLASTVPADALTEPRTVTRRPISVRPRETWSRTRLVVSFGCLFLLTAWWATRERIVFMLETMTVVGFLVALFGLVQFLTWNGKIYWVRKVPPSSSFGPFVNHNHFAGYVEMIIPVAISLAIYFVEIRRRGRGPVSSRRDGGAELDVSVEERSRWGKGGLAFFVAVILVVSLFFSLSRGGILSAIISAVILFMLVGRRIASRTLTWSLALGLPVLAVAFITWIGPRGVAQQLGTYPGMEEETSFRLRAMLWNRMIQKLPEYLWTGSGLGAFEESFAPFVPPGSPKRWDKAHNDYLQLFWETGIVGALLWLSALMIFAHRYWWPALRTRVHPLDVLRMGIAVSLLSIALHSLVDFNLQIGANGFLCALLAGLLVALERAVGRNGPRAQA